MHAVIWYILHAMILGGCKAAAVHKLYYKIVGKPASLTHHL